MPRKPSGLTPNPSGPPCAAALRCSLGPGRHGWPWRLATVSSLVGGDLARQRREEMGAKAGGDKARPAPSPSASGNVSSRLPRVPAQREGALLRCSCRGGGQAEVGEGRDRRGIYRWGCHLKHRSLPFPHALEEEAQQALAKRLKCVPLGSPPPRPTRRKTTFPRSPAGRCGRPGSPRPRPPSAAWHHGPCSPPALPAPFPRPGLGGREDYRSRVPPRRRACAVSVEVREAVALRATAEAAERL